MIEQKRRKLSSFITLALIAAIALLVVAIAAWELADGPNYVATSHGSIESWLLNCRVLGR